jgi:hypothetical protein
VSYLFGFPRAIIPGGVEMDLDAVATATSTDGKDKTAWKNFNFQMGALSSALEHAIPEQMFVTPENPGEGVSAVRALQKAAQQGQRIYHITQANMATALPNLHFHPETLAEIRQGLNSGKEVITHTDPISVPGWTGAGYVITDPETGAGAWKIGGGLNGAQLIVSGMVLLAITIAVAAFLMAGAPLGALVALGAGQVLALLAVAGASFIAAGVALVRGDLAACGNYLTAAWAALSLLVAVIVPLLGASAAVIIMAVFTNDVNQRVCR